MPQLMIQLHPRVTNDACGLCGKAAASGKGPHLVDAERPHSVCRDCGKRHAPALAALLDLATTAERVGQIGRHSVFPPLSALLDLARAAENYTSACPGALRRAG